MISCCWRNSAIVASSSRCRARFCGVSGALSLGLSTFPLPRLRPVPIVVLLYNKNTQGDSAPRGVNTWTGTKQTNKEVNSALFTRISRNLHPGHGTKSVMICIHYFFRQIFEPAQNGNKGGRDRHRIGGALRCDFLLAERFGMQTVRVPVGRVPQIKHTCEGRKYLLLKMPVITLMKKKLKGIQKTEIKVNEVQEIN
jgi:hypothetical protein